jgi:predicted DNA-binding transcriptional regulator AlpA
MSKGRKLRGIENIAKYIGFSIPTVTGWIQKENFPATRTQGDAGIYISSTGQIDKWWDEKIKSREKRRW